MEKTEDGMLTIKRQPVGSVNVSGSVRTAIPRLLGGLERFDLVLGSFPDGGSGSVSSDIIAIVVDFGSMSDASDLTDSEMDSICSSLKAGVNVLVLEPPGRTSVRLDQLSNASVTNTFPTSEWFLKPNRSIGQVIDRIPSEIAVESALSTYGPGKDFVAVVEVNIGLRNLPVVVATKVGKGNLIRAGLDSTTRPTDHLSRLISRMVTLPVLSYQTAKKTLGVGVVGYGPFGGMGHFHGAAAQATDGLRFVAAVDPDPNRRKAAESEFPWIRTYADAADLAVDDEVDIAIVATPPTSHFSIAMSLLGASKHVAVEKPMAITASEANQMIEAARASGVALTVNQNRRWDQDFRAVKRAVDGGRLGDVFNIETFVGGFEHPCRAWHSDETVSGGAAYDWGAHHIDWILQLIPELPTAVSAHGHKRVWNDVTNLDQIRLRLHYASGKEAEFFQSDVAGFRKPKFFIQGTRGTLTGNYRTIKTEIVTAPLGYLAESYHHAEAPAQLKLARYVGPDGLEVSEIPLPPPDKFGFHRNLADHLLLGEPLEVRPDAVLHVIRILEAAHLSSKSGGTVVELA